jgi:hypothetical protein
MREPLQAFAAANNLALIGTCEMLAAMGQGEGAVLLDGLRALAARSGHTEFERVPIFFFMGHTNGGGMASGSNSFLPERVGAFVASHGATFEDDSKLAGNNPGIFTAGENDPRIPPECIANRFARVRAQGARISLAVEEGAQHPAGLASMPFFLFTLQHVVEWNNACECASPASCFPWIPRAPGWEIILHGSKASRRSCQQPDLAGIFPPPALLARADNTQLGCWTRMSPTWTAASRPTATRCNSLAPAAMNPHTTAMKQSRWNARASAIASGNRSGFMMARNGSAK